jgi:UDP-N-acetylmuramate dehydrogenase
LIKESECQNLSVGSASISDKHCNFFVNNGNASATDIEQLIEKVKNKVLLNKGIKLELEIRIIGEK